MKVLILILTLHEGVDHDPITARRCWSWS